MPSLVAWEQKAEDFRRSVAEMGAAVNAAEGMCAPKIPKLDLSKVFKKVRGELEEVRRELGCAAEVTESAAPFGLPAPGGGLGS